VQVSFATLQQALPTPNTLPHRLLQHSLDFEQACPNPVHAHALGEPLMHFPAQQSEFAPQYSPKPEHDGEQGTTRYVFPICDFSTPEDSNPNVMPISQYFWPAAYVAGKEIFLAAPGPSAMLGLKLVIFLEFVSGSATITNLMLKGAPPPFLTSIAIPFLTALASGTDIGFATLQ